MFASFLRLVVVFGACNLAVAASDLDREIVLSPHRGMAPEDTEIIRWQERARAGGAGPETFERLGWAYVAKARRTLDAGFYKLAEKTADVIEQHFGGTADAQLLRGHVWHNLHRFQEAEAVAERLVAERGSPRDWALLSDVRVEQGKLAGGIAALQRLVDLKPGVEAYSRIAHVRWLKGDLTGAIAAMDTAVQASDARDGATEAWLLARLSGFHLQRGDAAQALALADQADAQLAAFPPALLARGRALLALGRIDDAVGVLQEAEHCLPLPEYQWWLADALAAAGRRAEAAAVGRRLMRSGAENDPRTLALFLATRGQNPAQAVRLARAEIAQRSDVFSHDALAWALAAAGEVDAARAEIWQALAEGTKDARLLLHAGEIALAQGDAEAAAVHFAAARSAKATLTPSEQARLARHDVAAGGVATR